MGDADGRGRPRTDAPLSVKIRLGDGRIHSSDLIHNISLGGIFIETPDAMPFGVEVALEFTLPVPPRAIRCRGFVVWSSRTHPDKCPGQQGVGIRLTDIGITEMRLLNDLAKQQPAERDAGT